MNYEYIIVMATNILRFSTYLLISNLTFAFIFPNESFAESKKQYVCIGKDTVLRYRSSSNCQPGERVLNAKPIKGAIGETGPVGPQGAAGVDGQAGPQGPAGAAGAAGVAGAAGAVGPVGPTGPSGALAHATAFTVMKFEVLPSTTSYMSFFTRNSGASESDIDQSNALLPMDCTFEGLFVHSLSMAVGDSIVVTLMLNNSATPLTCTLTGAGVGVASTCSDTNPAHAAPAVGGDLFTARFVSAANTSSPRLLIGLDCNE